jgi:hypothetical protein
LFQPVHASGHRSRVATELRRKIMRHDATATFVPNKFRKPSF